MLRRLPKLEVCQLTHQFLFLLKAQSEFLRFRLWCVWQHASLLIEGHELSLLAAPLRWVLGCLETPWVSWCGICQCCRPHGSCLDWCVTWSWCLRCCSTYDSRPSKSWLEITRWLELLLSSCRRHLACKTWAEDVVGLWLRVLFVNLLCLIIVVRLLAEYISWSIKDLTRH